MKSQDQGPPRLLTRAEADAAQAAAMTEAVLLSHVRRLARGLGWRGYHTRHAIGSDPGFPDLVLVRDGRLIFAELKREKGKTTETQTAWLDDLRLVAAATAAAEEDSGRMGDGERYTIEVHLWRPSDLIADHIADALR